MASRKFMVLLVVVAVGLFALAVHSVLRAIRGPERSRRIEYHGYKCTDVECGYSFALSAGSFSQVQEMRAGTNPSQPGLYCPKCRNRSVYKALYCPQCKKWFLPEVFTDPSAQSSVKCRKCGGSPDRWPSAEELPRHELQELTGGLEPGGG